MAREAVQHFLEFVRSAPAEAELVEWCEQELQSTAGLCHFCNEDICSAYGNVGYGRPLIDWIDVSPPKSSMTTKDLLHLCCLACWTHRRTVPYEVMLVYAKSLKTKEKMFCCGEFHPPGNAMERVLPAHKFDPDFTICQRCWNQQLAKRKVDWQEYLNSWTDPSDPRNKHLNVPTKEELERFRSRKEKKEEKKQEMEVDS